MGKPIKWLAHKGELDRCATLFYLAVASQTSETK